MRPPPPPVMPLAVPPPRTPQHAHTANAFATPIARHHQPAASPFAATPMKSEEGGRTAQFQTPVSSHTAAAVATPAAAHTPGPAAGSQLATMSEAESVKLMAALNQFVLVALQQQSAACVTAAQSGVRAVDAKNYTTLLSQLQAQHTDPLALSRWYAALSKSVSSFHASHHAELLQLLYNFNYCDAASMRNVEVLINLLVAMCVGGNQIHAIGPALKTMVNSFIATNGPHDIPEAATKNHRRARSPPVTLQLTSHAWLVLNYPPLSLF